MNMLTSQSTKNLASIMLGFGIGAVNTLVFYPYFFGAEKQGLVVFLLAVSNLLMPLIGFGVAQTIIKFHSSYAENERQGFLSYVVLLPLLIALPLGFVAIFFHDAVAGLLSVENPIIRHSIKNFSGTALQELLANIWYYPNKQLPVRMC